MHSNSHYDAILIGAGQAAMPLSIALAKAGWKTALIEREHVGGTCLNEGCTPTKTMVASGRVAYLARRAGDYGISTGPIAVDMHHVRQRKCDVVESFVSSSERRILAAGVDLIWGDASFQSPNTLDIQQNSGESRLLSADKIFIDTGGHPARPNLAGLDSLNLERVVDSTSIMDLDHIPEHLIILGGGNIGLEFGQLFRRFGSWVTILESSQRFLANEDEDVAVEVLKILREDGMDILLGVEVLKAAQGSNNSIRLELHMPHQELSLVGTHLLLAVGRRPNTGHLNLEAAGIATNSRGFIQVNEYLETSVPGIYAMGDVKGGPAFTHISYDDFRILRSHLLEGKKISTKGRLVPYVVFTDPQLGRVGLTEREAKAQGRNIRVAKIPMNNMSRALEVGEARGLLKAVVDADTCQILGFTALSLEGGEMMAMVEIAMMGNVPYTTLTEAIFAHPTLSEALNTLFASLE